MQLTLNFEADADSVDVAAEIAHRFDSRTVKLRQQQGSYQGPDGPVHTRTWVAFVETPWSADAALETAAELSDFYGQDCVAVRIDRGYHLAGPRAERWLPFNRDYFVEY